jgi:drug/metabolite transporter (DMT)-like permease
VSSRVWLAELSLVAMSLIWGVNYSVAKFGTTLVAPLAYNASRIVLAAVALLVIARVAGGSAPTRRDAVALFLLGILGNGVYQVFFIEGLARTRAGEAALVIGASPALIALLSWMRGIERLNTRATIGIAMSMFGVGLIVLGRATSGESAPDGSLLGDLLVLAGSLAWAIYTVLLMPYLSRVTGWWVSAWTMVGGAIVLAAVGGLDVMRTDWSALPAVAWGAIAYSSLGALVIAYMFWYYGVKKLGPTRTALYGNLQPLIALLVAWLTLGERPTIWQWTGASAIVSGVLLTRVQASEVS